MPGMVLAIEPMVNNKGPGTRILEDKWTAVTADGGFSAHFEHSVAVTENGPWILSEFPSPNLDGNSGSDGCAISGATRETAENR